MRNWKIGIFVFVIGTLIFVTWKASNINSISRDGKTKIKLLNEVVEVIRDENGMPYIYAESLEDVFLAQGYIMAQDRLFQMTLNRLFAEGRISELAGEIGIGSDKRMRTLGFRRMAAKHAAILGTKDRKLLQAFSDGVNEYIESAQEEVPVEFSLTGLQPEPWKIETSLTIMYYMGWNSAANLESEAIAQLLIDKIGLEKYLTIFPINTNPDDPSSAIFPDTTGWAMNKDLNIDWLAISKEKQNSLALGSNNWVAGSSKSSSGFPTLVNDPHLNSTLLPGVFYPMGLILPDNRLVGATVAGIPGILLGRSKFISMGLTNAYTDAQDLFIETVDPSNPDAYLEGETSLPFEIFQETLRIKSEEDPSGYREESMEIRLTNRGPVISGLMKSIPDDKLITFRWAAYETMHARLGFEALLSARTVEEARDILKNTTLIHINVVLADVEGSIGWMTTGRLPIREKGTGIVPTVVKDGTDHWIGWVSPDSMPHKIGKDYEWLGTANHNTVPSDYPHYVSSYYSPYYRYQRLKELMNSQQKFTPDDHWNFQRDVHNILASKLAPIYAEVLKKETLTTPMAEELSNWDYKETKESVAATIYQLLHMRIARKVFEDELGEELTQKLLGAWYLWQERLEKMVIEGESPWFDDIETKNTNESLEDLVLSAAKEIHKELNTKLGPDMSNWKWGKIHQITFLNPIRREGVGTEWLGGGAHEMGGSGETLYRGLFEFDHPEKVNFHASLRMVADMGDPDKVLAVISGGVSARTFDPHFKDQVEPYMNGEKRYWWLSDSLIQKNATHKMELIP